MLKNILTHRIIGYDVGGRLVYEGTRYVAILNGRLYENMYAVRDYVNAAKRYYNAVRVDVVRDVFSISSVINMGDLATGEKSELT